MGLEPLEPKAQSQLVRRRIGRLHDLRAHGHRGHPCGQRLGERDLEEIPSDVRERMEFNLVESMDEVVSLALDGTIVPIAAKEKLPEPVKVIEPPITH